MLCVQASAKQITSACEPDFFRWLKLPLAIYKAQVPVKMDASKNSRLDGLGAANISVVLPSDHLQALHDQGPKVSCHNQIVCMSLFIQANT